MIAELGQNKLPAAEFDVAFLVTVLGEIRDQPSALRELHEALRSGGILSVTEALPDPHYQRLSRVRQLTNAAGFREQRLFAGHISYTVNFVNTSDGSARTSASTKTAC